MTSVFVVLAAVVTVVPLWRLGVFHGLPRDAPVMALLFPLLAPFTACLLLRCVFDASFRRHAWATARGRASWS